MMAKRFRQMALAFGALVMCFYLAGCGGTGYPEPSLADVEAALVGQQILFNDLNLEIEANAISGLNVVEYVGGTDESRGVAILAFDYDGGRNRYSVEGVLSYTQSASDPFGDPRFEANDVTVR